jgi:hypothetical protein
VELVLLIGAAPFRLDEEAAWELVHAIREKCVDGDHRPLDSDALRALQLADMLAEDLDRAESPEPVEVGLPQARVLADYVLTPSVMRTEQLREFFDALVRFAQGRYGRENA